MTLLKLLKLLKLLNHKFLVHIWKNNETQYCGGILKLSINHWERDFHGLSNFAGLNRHRTCHMFRKMLTNPSYQFNVISYTSIFYEINFNFRSFIHMQIKTDHFGIFNNYSPHCYKPNSMLSILRFQPPFVYFHPLWPILSYNYEFAHKYTVNCYCRKNNNNNNNSGMNRPLSARFHYEHLSKSLRAKKIVCRNLASYIILLIAIFFSFWKKDVFIFFYEAI